MKITIYNSMEKYVVLENKSDKICTLRTKYC